MLMALHTLTNHFDLTAKSVKERCCMCRHGLSLKALSRKKEHEVVVLSEMMLSSYDFFLISPSRGLMIFMSFIMFSGTMGIMAGISSSMLFPAVCTTALFMAYSA